MSQKGVKGTEAHRAYLLELGATFGRNVSLAITRRNLSDAEVARRVGVSRTTIGNWMKGELPEWPSLAAAAVALDIPLSELFDGQYDARPQEDRLIERFEEKLKPLQDYLNRVEARLDGDSPGHGLLPTALLTETFGR